MLDTSERGPATLALHAGVPVDGVTVKQKNSISDNNFFSAFKTKVAPFEAAPTSGSLADRLADPATTVRFGMADEAFDAQPFRRIRLRMRVGMNNNAAVPVQTSYGISLFDADGIRRSGMSLFVSSGARPGLCGFLPLMAGAYDLGSRGKGPADMLAVNRSSTEDEAERGGSHTEVNIAHTLISLHFSLPSGISLLILTTLPFFNNILGGDSQ